MDRAEFREFFVCPHCGARVPRGAMSCRECGSDHETGWSEGAGEWESAVPSSGYDADDDDLDQDAGTPRAFPGSTSVTNQGMGWTAILVILILACVYWALVPLP